ncbi:hypothetical protein CYMTET_19761 [Cymbomonas tetramitiformis]|uniref:Uncharacterized protein n=1 Tax=Cymbomonas tetramitiformis TaxID=36881 RepID=A0AAE0G5Y1_9CHLO|nr:hypothetical protein CYMTET_19761 [Cymbomonas tetramitiformis]
MRLWESLDPTFYAVIRVRYPRLVDLQHVSLAELSDLVASVYVSWSSSQAEQGGTAGTVASAVVPPSDELILKLFAKIERIENFVKSHQRQGGAASLLPKRTRKGLSGYRIGSRPDPQVGFDARLKKAVPQCPRCPSVEGGHPFHTWDDCPLGGKAQTAGTTAAYCQPVVDCTPEVLHTLALCQVFQSAADNGPAAFSAACTQYGAPAVLNDGASAGGVDISTYGSATGESEDSDDEGMDVEAELQQLRRDVTAAAEVSMVQTSFSQPASTVVAASAAIDAPSYCLAAPTEEFPGGMDVLPPPGGPRTIEMGAHSMGLEPAY